MSDSAAGKQEFTELWRSVSKQCDGNILNMTTEQQMPGTAASPACKDFQSPTGRRWSRYAGLNYGDSPGDAEPSQDIVWDTTSPTAALTEYRNTRVVEISDIVNRIAPKDVKQNGTDSPLLKWIDDSAVPGTPDIPKPRVRKKSSRQSSVDDLLKLARQFDENMQQDRETSEEPNPAGLDERGNTSKTELRETPIPRNVKELKCPSSSDPVETELHALFDSSTQNISGRISQVSVPSSCSLEVKDPPVTSTSAEPGQTELKSADESGPAARPAEENNGLSGNNGDDFDDDWVNDDLINDPILLAITQNPHQQHDTTPKTTLQSDMKTNTTHFASACKSDLHSKPRCSALKELCPKPKTTNRSTFKLGSNPHFQPTPAAKDTRSESNFTFVQPKLQMCEQKPATRALSTPQPDKITNDQRETCVAADSAKAFSDSLWDDRDEDELLYQVCDSLERISNTQQQQVNPSDCQIKQSTAVDRQRKTTKPLPIDTVQSTSASSRANRQSPRAWVHSNSLPVTSCEVANYQGWNIPMKGANNKSQMSQSLPGSQVGLGTFGQSRDPSGTFQIRNDNGDKNAPRVTARAPPKSPLRALKRNLPDSADKSNKVFVTGQTTAKCSAAEIERKKQEALARKRLRMQNTPKP